MKEKIIGYTTGVFDLFHIGHLNILKRAKQLCDTLIVGVTVDELVYKRKNRIPVIPFNERCEIVEAIRYVDKVVPQKSMDKLEAWKRYNFDVMFVGGDWKGTDAWKVIENQMESVGTEVIYFPYTKTTSSTLINEYLNKVKRD